jgi:hypothetical protein
VWIFFKKHAGGLFGFGEPEGWLLSGGDCQSRIADVWQPNTLQWRLICVLAVGIVLLWPSQDDRSLGIKAVSWLADPMKTLPQMPPAFSLAGGDDAVEVEAHDEAEEEYLRVYQSSRIAHFRMDLRDMEEPFDPSTERQLLAVIGVVGGLLVWRLGKRPAGG